MQIEELNLDVRAYNQVKRQGIGTAEELLTRLYLPESVRDFPTRTMRHIEQALKAAGVTKFVRGDYITADDVEPEPIPWDALHQMCGRLIARDISTESRREFRVCWLYDFSGGRAMFQFTNNYANAGDDGRYYALKEDTEMIVTENRTPPADAELAVTEQYTEAYNLNVKIHVSMQAIQQNLYDMCSALKRMRDGKLYKELGYQNFEDYCREEAGISRQHAYRYIAILEKLPSDFVTSGRQIGEHKLYLLTALTDEQRQEITETVDLESTTVKELKAQIAQLAGKNEAMIRESRRDAEEIRQKDEQIGDLKSRLSERTERMNEMQQQIDELESRPVEVAVPEPSHEVANLMDAMRRIGAEHDAYNAKIQDDHFRHVQQIHAQHREEMQKLREEYEQKMKAQTGAENTDEAVFAVYLDAVRDAVEAAADFAEESGSSVVFSAQLCEMLQKLMEDI